MVEDIFSVYFNDWKSIFTFFVKATSLVHDLKKKRKKKVREKHTEGGLKPPPGLKHEIITRTKQSPIGEAWNICVLCTKSKTWNLLDWEVFEVEGLMWTVQ